MEEKQPVFTKKSEFEYRDKTKVISFSQQFPWEQLEIVRWRKFWKKTCRFLRSKVGDNRSEAETLAQLKLSDYQTSNTKTYSKVFQVEWWPMAKTLPEILKKKMKTVVTGKNKLDYREKPKLRNFLELWDYRLGIQGSERSTLLAIFSN